MPAKRTSRSTAILLFALLDRCRRKIMQRLEVLKQLEQLPAPLRLKSGQDLLERVFSRYNCEAARGSVEGQLARLIERYKVIKALLDAPIGADPEEEAKVQWLLDSEYHVTFRR
jgi:hypothetical protein